jgi:hypothetical protein
MYSLREIIIFFAGVQAFHTFTHLAFMFSGILPITIWGIHFTPLLNIAALIINGLSTVALMWWAAQLT